MGIRETPEYVAWKNMRARCNRPNHPDYANYGGRGITVCDRWDDFSLFLADVGARPSADLSIDRVDNARGYEPGNVRWATVSQQQANRREYGHKLTADDRAWIRANAGRVLQRVMAVRFGVDQSTISDVVRKRVTA